MELVLNGSKYHIYAQAGSDHALIFLHCFGSSSRAWRGAISRLQGSHYCLAPDLRGFGETAATTSRYRLGNYADDITALVDALKLKRYTVVGHAMGGKIALAYAARQPEGLSGLVLFAPSPPTPEPLNPEQRERLITGYGNRVVAVQTIKQAAVRELPIVEMKAAVEDNLRTSYTAWCAWLEQGSREDISPLMQYISVPTMIVAGGSDPNFSVGLLKNEVEQRIPTSRMAVVPGVGHLIPLEAPQVVASMLQVMLSGGFRI